VIELSRYELESLRADGEFNLYRGRGAGEPSSILVLTPVLPQPERGTVKRLEHEWSFRDELDPEWAVRDVAASLGTVEAYGLGLFFAGIVVTIVPLAVGILAGKYIFKFHPAITLGATAGTRTTTAALGALQNAANSTIPAIGYTIPYAVGRIVLALCGVIIVLLMK
jgi:Predicted Permease Membrane Region